MFDLCRDKYYLPADRERIVRLMLSFNEPMVAPANHHAQPAPAYICTLKEDEGFSVYIYLYLTTEKVGLLYRYADVIRNSEECKAAEEEAIQFTEDMGCLIDDLHFSTLLSEQQDKLLATIPLFSQQYKEAPPEEKPQEKIEPVQVEEIPAQAEVVVEKAAPVEEKKVEKKVEEETKESTGKEEQPWEPQIFLSKFRRRAMAEKEKKVSTENLGRLMATI